MSTSGTPAITISAYALHSNSRPLANNSACTIELISHGHLVTVYNLTYFYCLSVIPGNQPYQSNCTMQTLPPVEDKRNLKFSLVGIWESGIFRQSRLQWRSIPRSMYTLGRSVVATVVGTETSNSVSRHMQ